MAPCHHSRDTGAPGDVVKRDYSGLWILAATMLGSSMAFIDGTAVNVMLPILQDDLGASITDLQWGINAYGLSVALLLLVGGVLGGRLGRKRMFIAAVVMGVMALAFFNAALDDQLADRGVPSSIVEQLKDERVKLAGAEIPGGMTEADTAIVQSAVDEAFVESFQRMM